MRINEMVAGIRADLGIKLFGDDLEVLKEKAAEIELVSWKSIKGAARRLDRADHGTSGSQDRRSIGTPLSRYGVPARHVLDTITEAGGVEVGEVLEPGRRFPLAVRLPESYRDDPKALEKIVIPTASGRGFRFRARSP